jgi:hypothetical protein
MTRVTHSSTAAANWRRGRLGQPVADGERPGLLESPVLTLALIRPACSTEPVAATDVELAPESA